MRLNISIHPSIPNFLVNSAYLSRSPGQTLGLLLLSAVIKSSNVVIK